MTDAAIVTRLRHIARKVLDDREWALGLEVDDLIGPGWLAYHQAVGVARTTSYRFERARFAMIEAIRAWYDMQRHVESAAAARAAGRTIRQRRVRWEPVGEMLPWHAMAQGQHGAYALADITPHEPPTPSWSPSPDDCAALELRLVGLEARPATVVRLLMQGETLQSVATRLGVGLNAVYVAKSKALSHLRRSAMKPCTTC